MGSRGSWRVVLVHDDGTGSKSVRLSDRRFIGAAILVAVLLGAGFTAIGLAWRTGQKDARIAELEDQLAASGAQTQQVRQLAARLERAESNYRQLQQIMGGDVTGSGQDVKLPTLPASRGGDHGERPTGGRQEIPGTWPVTRKGFVSRSFEPAGAAALGEHRGVDIAIPTGSYVRASGSGTVEEVGDDSVFGLFVRVEHAEGFETLYAHNSALFVAEGDSVEQNEVLALSGNTGRSSAPHLHFEIRKNGRAVDPAAVIGGK